MKFLYTLILSIFFTCLYSQSLDVIQSNKDVNLHLAGMINTGQNAIGSARLFFHRNNDNEEGLIKWNLNKASNLYVEIDTTENVDYWQTGVDGNDDFKIAKYKYRFYEITGPLEETTNAMIIKDTYSGNNPDAEPKIIFPGGSIEIGSGNKILGTTSGVLEVDGADLIASDCGFNLGSGSIPWSEIYAGEYITQDRCLGPVNLSKKSNYSAISTIQQINMHYLIDNKSIGQPGFYIAPQELIKAVPEAVYMNVADQDATGGNKTSSANQMGIRYNQLINVLIQAMQEQQQMIDQLSVQLHSLKSEK